MRSPRSESTSQIVAEALKNEHFCAAPFGHLQFHTTIQYRPCCMYNGDFISAKGVTNLQEVYQDPKYQQMRKDMLNNIPIPGCSKCYRNDKLGLESGRKFHNRTISISDIYNPQIQTLELTFGNKCNMRCITCSLAQSSSWYEQHKEIYALFNNGKELVAEQYQNFDVDIDSIVSLDLQEIKILGGEPFLDKRYFQVLDKLSPDCKVMMVTNNSIAPTKEQLKILSKFKHVSLHFSIDGVGEVGEFVRTGLNMKRWERNLHKWLSFLQYNLGNHNIWPRFHYVIHALNILNIDKTLKYLSNLVMPYFEMPLALIDEVIYVPHTKYENSDWLNYDFLQGPDYLNCQYLTDEYKQYVINKIEQIELPLFNNYFTLKKDIITFLKSHKTDQRAVAAFIKYCEYLDNKYTMPLECRELYEKCLK